MFENLKRSESFSWVRLKVFTESVKVSAVEKFKVRGWKLCGQKVFDGSKKVSVK